MKVHSLIAEKVQEIYDWIDAQIREHISDDQKCQACSNCCNFNEYGHRLFVTMPELLHFRIGVGKDAILPMNEGVCPYMEDGKCSVHEHRFSGCRIFYCKGCDEFQSELSEEAIRRFKAICEEFSIPYQYKELSHALNFLADSKRF